MDTLNGKRVDAVRPQSSTAPHIASEWGGDLPAVNSQAMARQAIPQEPTLLQLLWRPVLYSLLGALALLAFYLGIIIIAQGWSHAIEQLVVDRWFVGAIAIGFETQLGLFSYLRSLHTRAMVAGVVTSTATSTVAMLACCAHHVTDILPIIGLSGAAIFLDAYKTPLLWLGIAMNAVGIVYLLYQIKKAQATLTTHECPMPN